MFNQPARKPDGPSLDLTGALQKLGRWSGKVRARWLPQAAVPPAEHTAAGEQAAVAALHDPAAPNRWRAATTLGRSPHCSREAIEALIGALADPEPFVRWHAAEALGAQEAGQVFPALQEALADADPGRRAGAAEALGRLGGEAACEELRWGLADPDPAVRVSTAEAYGRCAGPSMVPILLPWLVDPEPAVRAAIAATLGRIGDPQAAPLLAESLARLDEPLLVRRALAAALARMPHPEAQPVLLAALEDPDAQVRGYAIQALGQVGDETGRRALTAMQRDHSRLLNGTVADAARRAIAALERRARQGERRNGPPVNGS